MLGGNKKFIHVLESENVEQSENDFLKIVTSLHEKMQLLIDFQIQIREKFIKKLFVENKNIDAFMNYLDQVFATKYQKIIPELLITLSCEKQSINKLPVISEIIQELISNPSLEEIHNLNIEQISSLVKN
jgi:polyribonucleotide nucleotidyltransferase